MAAENLENTGKKLGISLKAETDGSGGAQNVLTKEEIAAAEAIIVAADKNVEMARFDGKPVIMVPVADGIHKAEALINQAVSGTVPVYHYSGDVSGAASCLLYTSRGSSGKIRHRKIPEAKEEKREVIIHCDSVL